MVPTWNYTVVHAYGSLRIIDDTAWLRSQLDALTNQHEATFQQPWTFADAPHDFTEKLFEAIVGLELMITRLSGKWKVSQNQPSCNQASVFQGLVAGGKKDIAALVEAGIKNLR